MLNANKIIINEGHKTFKMQSPIIENPVLFMRVLKNKYKGLARILFRLDVVATSLYPLPLTINFLIWVRLFSVAFLLPITLKFTVNALKLTVSYGNESSMSNSEPSTSNDR